MSIDLQIFLIATIFPLMFGAIIMITSIAPVAAPIFGFGLFQDQKGMFLGFILSFSFFRILISGVVKLFEMPLSLLEYIGIFFLILFGLLMIRYSWKAIPYSICLGFIWAFWVGLFKDLPGDDNTIRRIDLFVIYTTSLSSIVPGIALSIIGWILSKIYPTKYRVQIQKVLGYLTVITAILLLFHLLPVAPRQGIKPAEPPPVPLHKLFYPN